MKTLTGTDLQAAYDGSFYTISGAGGDVQEWVDGYEKLMKEGGIGTPTEWLQCTGADINAFAGENDDPYPDDLVCLLFPLEGLDIGRLAMFKLQMMDRWFDDIIDNMRAR